MIDMIGIAAFTVIFINVRWRVGCFHSSICIDMMIHLSCYPLWALERRWDLMVPSAPGINAWRSNLHGYTWLWHPIVSKIQGEGEGNRQIKERKRKEIEIEIEIEIEKERQIGTKAGADCLMDLFPPTGCFLMFVTLDPIAQLVPVFISSTVSPCLNKHLNLPN